MGYQVVLIAALHQLGLRVIHFKWCLSANHLPDELLTTDENVGSVQESENAIPEFSWKEFEVIIRRVQSPVPLGDSSLRVQLGPKLTRSVLPTGGVPPPRLSSSLPSTCSVQEQYIIILSYSARWFLLTHIPSLFLHAARKKYWLFELSVSSVVNVKFVAEQSVIFTIGKTPVEPNGR